MDVICFVHLVKYMPWRLSSAISVVLPIHISHYWSTEHEESLQIRSWNLHLQNNSILRDSQDLDVTQTLQTPDNMPGLLDIPPHYRTRTGTKGNGVEVIRTIQVNVIYASRSA